MNTKSALLERYSLPAFLILTPLLSLVIAFFIPLPIELIALLLILVPATMAILITALAEGRKSVAIRPDSRQPGYGNAVPFCE